MVLVHFHTSLKLLEKDKLNWGKFQETQWMDDLNVSLNYHIIVYFLTESLSLGIFFRLWINSGVRQWHLDLASFSFSSRCAFCSGGVCWGSVNRELTKWQHDRNTTQWTKGRSLYNQGDPLRCVAVVLSFRNLSILLTTVQKLHW